MKSNDGVAPLVVMNFSMEVLEHDFVSEQCKWNGPRLLGMHPAGLLKGDNWKIQDTAVVGERDFLFHRFTRCTLDVEVAELARHRTNFQNTFWNLVLRGS